MVHPLTVVARCLSHYVEMLCARSGAPTALNRKSDIFVRQLRLPPELWAHVLEQLWDDPPSLQACSLTCRAWLPTTRRLLFHHIEFKSRGHFLRFSATLDHAKTDIAGSVRSVAIVGLPLGRLGRGDAYDDRNGLIVHGVLKRLPNVTSLTLDDVDIDVHLPLDRSALNVQLYPFLYLFPVPCLRTLDMSLVMFHSFNDIGRLIAAFPQLRALTIERALWWQDTTAPLRDEERVRAETTLQDLVHLNILCALSPVDLLQRFLRFPEFQSITGRQFGWTTYVANEKALLLWILRSSAANVRMLDVVTRYDSNLLSELDARAYTHAESLSIQLAASLQYPDPFCGALPSFIAHLESPHLLTFNLGFSLFRPTSMYWTFVDWPALDAALATLHMRYPEMLVFIQLAFVDAVPQRENLDADIAAPLIGNLRGALSAGTQIGLRCVVVDQIGGRTLEPGALRWLALNGR